MLMLMMTMIMIYNEKYEKIHSIRRARERERERRQNDGIKCNGFFFLVSTILLNYIDEKRKFKLKAKSFLKFFSFQLKFQVNGFRFFFFSHQQ